MFGMSLVCFTDKLERTIGRGCQNERLSSGNLRKCRGTRMLAFHEGYFRVDGKDMGCFHAPFDGVPRDGK